MIDLQNADAHLRIINFQHSVFFNSIGKKYIYQLDMVIFQINNEIVNTVYIERKITFK